MTTAIRESLPFAVAILISTAPILAIVLMMVTSRPARVSVMFLLGWAAGILAVAGAVVAFVDTTVPRGGLSTAGAIVRIVLGVTLGVLAARAWRQRASAGAPKWMSGVMGWSSSRALTTGFALGSISPKNLALIGAGAASILTATSIPYEQAVTLVVFAAVASLGVATPIVLRAVGGPTVSRGLDRATAWMTTNGKTISVIVLAIIAVVLVVTGVSGLSTARA